MWWWRVELIWREMMLWWLNSGLQNMIVSHGSTLLHHFLSNRCAYWFELSEPYSTLPVTHFDSLKFVFKCHYSRAILLTSLRNPCDMIFSELVYLQVVSFSINHSRLSSLWIQGSHPVFVLFLPLFLWGLEPLCDCWILTYISGIRYAHCPIPHSTWQCILWCITVSPSLLYFSSEPVKSVYKLSLCDTQLKKLYSQWKHWWNLPWAIFSWQVPLLCCSLCWVLTLIYSNLGQIKVHLWFMLISQCAAMCVPILWCFIWLWGT